MLAPKCATYNSRLTFANPRYLKKAQSEKPCLYEIPFDTSDPANKFAPKREKTMTLDNEISLSVGTQQKKLEDKRRKLLLESQCKDKNIAISELKKLIENCNGKSVETQVDKPSIVRQPNAQRIPKPSVLGKPTPFSNSPEMRKFSILFVLVGSPQESKSTSLHRKVSSIPMSKATKIDLKADALYNEKQKIPPCQSVVAEITDILRNQCQNGFTKDEIFSKDV
ncbi:hypothetical protein Tco_0976991 [Tanacetum coccineum]|uniref:Uncharacterized protein n=1 Tax=Tanacetum coccineum TaxID=301880 RepID=A0ABQ5EIW9_9ASTR